MKNVILKSVITIALSIGAALPASANDNVDPWKVCINGMSKIFFDVYRDIFEEIPGEYNHGHLQQSREMHIAEMLMDKSKNTDVYDRAGAMDFVATTTEAIKNKNRNQWGFVGMTTYEIHSVIIPVVSSCMPALYMDVLD
ncbi:hypothetical protein [Moritella viscosa]|uniref:Diguanylate cyclase with GAF sensor n=1 Tax=Moritella viscosa TaxID=80854 RepID=A0A090K674_9GAMM|nr:hypothetical protein [Moritella viscosa]CED59288.1 putative exported protein [Moritella viscosa]SGY85557.1 Diguanylate cyclase with GAF sensor [Moritella viscosa]SGY86729.1 Diguanylate cyclase with GAF sensor [Moritella viscosa]SGY88048.1 Diguanylate cyclase with GAF sensor [Moritella viscosa]SGY88677.1 Diguanylate cyclase with GAF sensor [Moritella viscosa]